MITVLWIFGVIIANMVLGAVVWTAIDHEDQRFYRWYAACPPQISWLLQPLVLMAWPVGLWLRLKGKA
jgi:hypothetical protein